MDDIIYEESNEIESENEDSENESGSEDNDSNESDKKNNEDDEKITFKRKSKNDEIIEIVDEKEEKKNRMNRIINRNLLTAREGIEERKSTQKGALGKESLPYIEKYRPANLSEVISHDNKVEVLNKLIDKRELPHLLFYGQSGTGKTSTILALAKQMYGVNYRRYILELNASDDRGIEMVRSKIPTFAKTKTDDLRLVILDEADAMTSDAQSALRRIMELYIKNCRFCLICNNINKILPGIQSRCAKMRFGVLDRDSIRKKLGDIIEKEEIKINKEAIDELLEIQQDFRQILNTLQCLKSIRFGEMIRREDVSDYLGKPNKEMVAKIVEILENESYRKAYTYLIDLHRENKICMIDLIQNLVNHMIDRDDMTEQRRSIILDGLAKIEYRMITGSDSEIQLASLVGIMISNRENNNQNTN